MILLPTEIIDFIKTIEKTKGNVYLVSDKTNYQFDLKDTSSRKAGIGMLLSKFDKTLHVKCENPSDEELFLKFYIKKY